MTRIEVSKGQRGPEEKHILASDDMTRMKVSKEVSKEDKRESTYMLVTTQGER